MMKYHNLSLSILHLENLTRHNKVSGFRHLGHQEKTVCLKSIYLHMLNSITSVHKDYLGHQEKTVCLKS